MRSIIEALERITGPLYRPIRKLLPDFGGIDFSPLVVVLIIIVAQKLLPGFAGSRPNDHMTAKLIDGKARGGRDPGQVAAGVAEFEQRPAARPGLATVLVGEDPASAVYVRSKNQATAEAGMASFAHNLPDDDQRGRAARRWSTELNADRAGRRHPRPAAAAAADRRARV